MCLAADQSRRVALSDPCSPIAADDCRDQEWEQETCFVCWEAWPDAVPLSLPLQPRPIFTELVAARDCDALVDGLRGSGWVWVETEAFMHRNGARETKA